MDNGRTEAYTFTHEGANFAGALVHLVRVVLASGSARPHSLSVCLATLTPITAGGYDSRCGFRAAACSSFFTCQAVGRQAIVPDLAATFTSSSCLHFSA